MAMNLPHLRACQLTVWGDLMAFSALLRTSTNRYNSNSFCTKFGMESDREGGEYACGPRGRDDT